jgi:hypothetical protein
VTLLPNLTQRVRRIDRVHGDTGRTGAVPSRYPAWLE